MTFSTNDMNINVISTAFTTFGKMALSSKLSEKQLRELVQRELKNQEVSRMNPDRMLTDHCDESDGNFFTSVIDSGNSHEMSAVMDKWENETQCIVDRILLDANFLKIHNIKKIYAFYETNEIWFLTDKFTIDSLMAFDHDIFNFLKTIQADAVTILVGLHELNEENMPAFSYEKEV